ncbi:MAG: NUDIX domain-containing protein [Clostridiales bacterium]|nr:NUDIX domain-containing protein [Clostridiales bacterium]
MRCECGNVIYPKIAPAVIVGVTNGDRLLVTKYRTGYNHFALVAGFTEIGETLEQTVAREVMEETGLKVTNIRYYKSQPWGIAGDLLAGFYCDVQGDDTIKMDEGELKVAEWRTRSDIELQPGQFSLTNEMMMLFKEGKT